jgi:hypothetical protein
MITDEIDSFLKTVDYFSHKNNEPKTLETLIANLKDVKDKLNYLKVMLSKDVTGTAAERNMLILSVPMDEEEEGNYDDDYNINCKNQEVDEYYISGDSFCSKVIDRFESRLFGHGEKSIDKEVQDLIFKSRNRERLAIMYEGWMPWI